MSIDWKDQRRVGCLRAYMVPPTAPDDIYGELAGVDWASSSITASYYSDTRTSGTLMVVDDGSSYIRPSFIRVVYEIPEWNYKRTLGTYAVTNEQPRRRNGRWYTQLELNSMLYTMSLDIAQSELVVAAGSRVQTAMATTLKTALRQYNFADANDYKVGTTNIMESGQSRLSRMFALCELSNNRLDVDPNGVVTVAKYVNPAAKTASFTIDVTDPRGIARDDLELSTNYTKVPSESLVIYRWTTTESGESKQHELYGDVENWAGKYGTQTRGYRITDYHALTEMVPATSSRALEIAKEYYDNRSEAVEWTLTAKYLPIWEGDVVNLVVPDGYQDYVGVRKCLVKNVDFDGLYMDMKLTLKDLGRGDI